MSTVMSGVCEYRRLSDGCHFARPTDGQTRRTQWIQRESERSMTPRMPKHVAFDLALTSGGSWKVNGRKVEEDVSDFLNEWAAVDIHARATSLCTFCGINLRIKRLCDGDAGAEEPDYNRRFILFSCRRCGHWQFAGGDWGTRCMDPQRAVAANSVLARFETTLPDGCAGELAQHLRRNPSLWHEIEPQALERFVAEIFRANYRHVEVVHVGRPADRGTDVVFVDDDLTRWLIQVKRRGHATGSEGFSTLQNILGTLALKGERHGIIVTTADSFSYQARADAVSAAAQGFRVRFVAKAALDRMLDPLIPKCPWHTLLAHPVFRELGKDVVAYFSGDDRQLDIFDEPRSFSREAGVCSFLPDSVAWGNAGR